MRNVEIGNRMRQVRKSHNMSREQLAERAGVSSKFIYEIERGMKGMSAETVSKIAKALGESCDFLINGQDEEGDSREKVLNIIEQYDDKQVTALLHLLQAADDIHIPNPRRRKKSKLRGEE